MKGTSFITFTAAALVLVTGCGGSSSPEEPVTPEPEVPAYAKGADLGWITEMESKGYGFSTADGKKMECTALFKELGFNAVRHRVWVDPTEGWCNVDDVVEKCLRAQKLGMKVMIDFHYSDWWADPGKQNVPAAWTGLDVPAMADAVAEHTTEVLSALKTAGVDVTWVQIGNEVTNGMLWESGRVQGQDAANFTRYFNAGAAAAKKVYPSVITVLHIDNGWNAQTLTWFFSLVKKSGAQYDMAGLSLYPSYWDESTQSYPDWKSKCSQFINNLSSLHNLISKPIMLCEFGMPASEPAKCSAALTYLMRNTKNLDWFKGIFYWEPESEQSRNGYAYGAFADGKPTSALDPFKD